jgi:nitroreductase
LNNRAWRRQSTGRVKVAQTSAAFRHVKRECHKPQNALPKPGRRSTFGRMTMLNDRSTPLSLLETRRSGRPRDLIEPGPGAAEMARMLAAAARTPDHGKLHPWRFVHVARDRRGALSDLLFKAYRAQTGEPTEATAEAIARLAYQAPELVVALFSPRESAKIPLWEQQLSCGAACMNLAHAAHALGYAAGWITGWAAYSPIVRDGFGSAPEQIAGFIYIGTPAAPLEERARPAIEEVVSRW